MDCGKIHLEKSIVCDLYSFPYIGFHGAFLSYEGDAALLVQNVGKSHAQV